MKFIEKFTEFVYKYFGYFFWIEIAYAVFVFILCILLELPDWVSVVCMLPLNLISWPVLFASEKAEHQRFKSRQGGPPLYSPARKIAFAMVLASAGMLLMLILGIWKL